MSIKTTIQNTEVYQSLSFMQKTMVSKLQSQKDIEHAISVIGNIGYEKWKEQCNLSPIGKRIIKELNQKK